MSGVVERVGPADDMNAAVQMIRMPNNAIALAGTWNAMSLARAVV